MRDLNYVIEKADAVKDGVMNKFVTESDTMAFDTNDGVIIGLLEDILGKIKSLNVLIEENSLDGIDVLMRSAFEGYVYLTYILERDSENRAKAYANKSKIEDIKLFERIIAKNKAGKKAREFLGQNREDILGSNPQYSQKSKAEIHEKYKELMNSEDIKKNWYDSDNKTKNFEQLCRKLGLEAEYVLIFRLFSKEVHSNAALARVNFLGGRLLIGNSAANSVLHKNLSEFILIEIIRKVLSHYNMTSELRLFNANISLRYRKK